MTASIRTPRAGNLDADTRYGGPGFVSIVPRELGSIWKWQQSISQGPYVRRRQNKPTPVKFVNWRLRLIQKSRNHKPDFSSGGAACLKETPHVSPR